MSDNPWLPIDTMPLSTVGTEVDIKDQQRLYSGITVSGVQYERDVLIDVLPGIGDHIFLGEINVFTITHTGGTVNVPTDAEWRPHP